MTPEKFDRTYQSKAIEIAQQEKERKEEEKGKADEEKRRLIRERARYEAQATKKGAQKNLDETVKKTGITQEQIDASKKAGQLREERENVQL